MMSLREKILTNLLIVKELPPYGAVVEGKNQKLEINYNRPIPGNKGERIDLTYYNLFGSVLLCFSIGFSPGHMTDITEDSGRVYFISEIQKSLG